MCRRDPLVASEMAGALIHGVQSKNVGTSIKHFLANNQETRRMSSDSRIDERTLNEIYLAAFDFIATAVYILSITIELFATFAKYVMYLPRGL